MKKQATAAFLAVLLAVSMASMVSADSQESDVDVEVTGETTLDVRPTSLLYDPVEPGEQVAESVDGFTALELENIGSEELEQISIDADMPAANPFGTGDSASYNAGNILRVSTATANNDDYNEISIAEGTSEDLHYVNRVEFTEDPAPTYLQTLEEASTAYDELANYGEADFDNPAQDVGRFREGNQEYFYVIYYDETSGAASCSGGESAEMWVGTSPHDETTLGTYDFTDSTAGDIEILDIVDADADNIGTAESGVSLADTNYRAYTYCGDDTEPGHTIRTRFNVDVQSPVIDDGLNSVDSDTTYILDSDTSPLEPGASFPLDLAVEAPLGVAAGSLDQGTLTVQASQIS